MRGLVTKDALTDEITRAREQHGDEWQSHLQQQYDGRFYERLQEAWGNEWSTRLDIVLQGSTDGWLIEQIRNESYILQVGNKRYELANHLGNVLAVVSDKKEQSDGAAWSAVVVSAQDYFPFGMAMPGRSTDRKHRYGFNGKETDPETGIQDYGMRWYLPNIARFPSVDPITKQYPELTPYQFASNTPIMAIDLDGLESAMITHKQTCDGGKTLMRPLTTEEIVKFYTVHLGTPMIAKMAVDADGSYRTYTIDNGPLVDPVTKQPTTRMPLDNTVHAQYSKGKNKGKFNPNVVVCGTDGKPVTRTDNTLITMTSIFRDEIDAQGNTTRVYADAETVPFVALSGTEMKDFKVKKGDIGFVYNSKTGQSSFFIIAETGPGGGEGSIQLCKNVGIEKINPHPKVGENANKGSDQKTFHYFFFKDSGDGTLKTNAEIESIGQKRLNDSLTN